MRVWVLCRSFFLLWWVHVCVYIQPTNVDHACVAVQFLCLGGPLSIKVVHQVTTRLVKELVPLHPPVFAHNPPPSHAPRQITTRL